MKPRQKKLARWSLVTNGVAAPGSHLPANIRHCSKNTRDKHSSLFWRKIIDEKGNILWLLYWLVIIVIMLDKL